MNIKLLKILCVGLYTLSINASMVTEVIPASQMKPHQWQAVNNLWMTSFYNAYKNLPLHKIDDIQEQSQEALINYLRNLFEKCRLAAIKNSYALVLMYNANRLVGYTLYGTRGQQSIIHIDHFAIDPMSQGKGIGRILLDATIKAKPGTTAVILTTRILNTAAQSFYKKLGFYELKSIECLPFDARYSILLRKDVK